MYCSLSHLPQRTSSHRVTGLHRREDVDETGMVAARGEDLADPIFLAEALDALNVLDLYA